MKTVLLSTAVLLRIQHFNAMKLDFSAHDVTVSIREKIETGDLDISDVERDIIDGSERAIVEHSKVRQIVKELFAEEFVPNYTASYSYNAEGEGFVKYIHVAPALTSPPTAPAGDDAGKHTVPASDSRATTRTALKQPDDAMLVKLRDYLDNVKAKGRYSTPVKQIQSRLKGYKITCAQLCDLLEKNDFYVAPADNGCHSQYLVITLP